MAKIGKNNKNWQKLAKMADVAKKMAKMAIRPKMAKWQIWPEKAIWPNGKNGTIFNYEKWQNFQNMAKCL